MSTYRIVPDYHEADEGSYVLAVLAAEPSNADGVWAEAEALLAPLGESVAAITVMDTGEEIHR